MLGIPGIREFILGTPGVEALFLQGQSTGQVMLCKYD